MQSWIQIATQACGFITIVAGTFLLHTTKDLDISVGDLNRLTKEPTLGLSRTRTDSSQDGSTRGMYHGLEMVDANESSGRSSKLWKQMQGVSV